MMDWKKFNENMKKDLEKISQELKSMWNDGTATINGYKKLTQEKIKIRKQYETKRYELFRIQEKKRITDLRKGSILITRGILINSNPYLAVKKAKLIRKGEKRATVKILEGPEKGNIWRIHYRNLLIFNPENKDKMMTELESNKLIRKVFGG
jgi:hypothetical protein